jgi:hypothetical protein
MVRDDCTRRLDELERTQPTIILTVTDAAGHDVIAVKVSVDGKVVAEKLDGKALLVDPGAREFTFEVPGQPPVKETILIREAEKNRNEKVVIGPAPPAAPPPLPSPPPTPPPKAPEPNPPTPLPPQATAQPTTGLAAPEPAAPMTEPVTSSSGSGMKSAGLVVGGVGIAGLIAAGVFGGLSLSAHRSFTQHCGSNIGAAANECDAIGISGQQDAESKGNIATGFLVGGGVATAVGLALFVLGSTSKTDVHVGVGPTGFAVIGRF